MKSVLYATSILVFLALSSASAQTPSVEDEKDFPLAIIFALIAVFCSLGAVFAATRNKKK